MSGQTRAQLCELWEQISKLEKDGKTPLSSELVRIRSELFRIICEAE